jgi:anti-sigma factor RsiW
VVGVLAVIACLIAILPPNQAPELLRMAVVGHERYTQSPEALPIRGHDTTMVATQLEQHLPFRLGLPPEAVEGVQLSGGAVLSVDNTQAALLVYRVNETPVSLLLTTPQGIVTPVREMITFKNILFHAGNWGDHHTLQWSDRRFTYVLVSNDRDAVYRACVICHSSPQGLETIAGFFQGI